MDDDVQTIFLSARKKLKAMSEEDYQKLDFRDTLLIEEEVAYG